MPDAATTHYMKALSLFGEGKHAEAVVEYEAALAERPDWCEVMLGLATCKMHLGELDEAIRIGKRVAELDKEDPFVHTSLSIFYQRKSSLAEATGDKEATAALIAEAEKEGNKARLLSWKQELKNNPDAPPPDLPGGLGVVQ